MATETDTSEAQRRLTPVVHPTAIIERGAHLGQGVVVGPFCVVGPDVHIGAGSRLHSSVVITGDTTIGNDCEFFPGAVIGAPPQLSRMPEGTSRLVVGDRCVFREHVTIHAGSPIDQGLTSIGDDCLFMVGTHVAHDCIVGDKCTFANGAMVAGHAHLGRQVYLGGASAVHQFTHIGDHAMVAGGAILVDDVIPFVSVVGNQARVESVNVNGLKRRGFSRQDMHVIRNAVFAVYKGEGTFDDRLSAAEHQFSGQAYPEQIFQFIRSDRKRPLCKFGA